MDLHKLRTFRTVAALLNFNRAAELLHLAQSTVSAQIRNLEEEIGVPLFERNGKRVALTEAGASMLDYAHKLIAIEEEAIHAASGRGAPSGRINLRVPQSISTYCLPHILALYLNRFPKINFDVSSCALYALERELDIGTIDLAFLLADSINSSGLDFEMLGVEPLVLVAGPEHPLTKKKEIRYPDLQGTALFLPKADCGYRMTFERTLAAVGVEPAAYLDMNSLEAIKQCVLAGLGAALMPRMSAAREIARGELKVLPLEDDLETGIIMIRRKDKWMSPALEEFIKVVRKWFSENR